MCAKTTTISTEWIEAAISASLKRLDFKEVRKHQELALHCFIDGNDFFVSPPTGSGKSLCYWMLQAAFNLHTIELTPLARHAWLHFYGVTLPIIAFHIVTIWPRDTRPFFPAALLTTPINTGKSVWLARLGVTVVVLHMCGNVQTLHHISCPVPPCLVHGMLWYWPDFGREWLCICQISKCLWCGFEDRDVPCMICVGAIGGFPLLQLFWHYFKMWNQPLTSTNNLKGLWYLWRACWFKGNPR